MKFSFLDYLKQNHYADFDLKAVLFDMDGVLYDSMPAHARSWQETMEERGYTSTTPEEFYFHEGRIGSSTIDIITEREFGRKATEEEIQDIYARKSALFAQYNQGKIIPGIKEIIGFVKSNGLKPVLVTGSGQPSLLNRLDTHFPGVFTPQTMVTAFDVKHGKPHPEPYLMGLQKGGDLKPNQAIVIENAPLGIESAVGAGIFTIAVNTGPLPDSVLTEAGASVIFSSMEKLLETMPEILRLTQTISI
ncbi:haloacid dehalogenase superfamily, subfamily IA, variant 3 with third motif having DD or ED [Porphyromonadaceae bacterium KH3CP3RA]|nr:haloacid dehalogenase superfamily, subfamily IA, variant 3 with third motif having DD or ED [Porphyromonadaceae bacterium KH3CP3RA]